MLVHNLKPDLNSGEKLFKVWHSIEIEQNKTVEKGNWFDFEPTLEQNPNSARVEGKLSQLPPFYHFRIITKYIINFPTSNFTRTLTTHFF